LGLAAGRKLVVEEELPKRRGGCPSAMVVDDNVVKMTHLDATLACPNLRPSRSTTEREDPLPAHATMTDRRKRSSSQKIDPAVAPLEPHKGRLHCSLRLHPLIATIAG
jgi:hypothetical protein